jgi:hypothetical protein
MILGKYHALLNLFLLASLKQICNIGVEFDEKGKIKKDKRLLES